MKVTVCIGSSCHLKGSRQVVESFQRNIADNGLKDCRTRWSSAERFAWATASREYA